jgi:surfeit locus 1 family protein
MKFSFQNLRFSPTLVPTLAALAAAILTGYLGHWQQGRAAEKRALQREFDLRSELSPVRIDSRTRDPAMRYRQALAEGEWHAPRQIYIDNQVRHEVAGYHVITPLKLQGTDCYVLVNRGWIARGTTYPAPPFVDVPSGPVSVVGQLTLPSDRFLELSAESNQGAVWQNLTIERFREATGFDALPFVLLAHDAQASLEAIVDRPDARADKHVEYMLTWYSLAVTVIVLWLALNTKMAPTIVTDSMDVSVEPRNLPIGNGDKP